MLRTETGEPGSTTGCGSRPLPQSGLQYSASLSNLEPRAGIGVPIFHP